MRRDGRVRRVFGTGHGEHAVPEIGGDAFGVDRQGQLKRAAETAVTALDAVELLAGRFALPAHARDGQAPVMVLELHIVLGEARQLRGHDVGVGCLVQVDRRRPAGTGRWQGGPSAAGRPADPEADPSVRKPRGDRTTVNSGTRKRQAPKAAGSCSPEPVAQEACATIERFYKRYLWLLYKQRD